MRADLRVQASELATSLRLQRAVVMNDQRALKEIAATGHARIDLRDGRSIGKLAAKPRIASTATISNGQADPREGDGLASARQGRAHGAPPGDAAPEGRLARPDAERPAARRRPAWSRGRAARRPGRPRRHRLRRPVRAARGRGCVRGGPRAGRRDRRALHRLPKADHPRRAVHARAGRGARHARRSPRRPDRRRRRPVESPGATPTASPGSRTAGCSPSGSRTSSSARPGTARASRS